MARLTQIIQNTLIRVTAFVSVLFKNIFGLIRNVFNAVARLFGFNKPSYFLESEEAQSVKKYSEKQPTITQADTTPNISTSDRRRPNAKMDYYIKMAREIQNN
ncbi:hypothetical protein Nos7524_0729 [Nostoc sp. PCC 7524]|uniref:hypothetical protein n=1 Tax=Nostoc sp. (strain ATCC 29411 / PCC 7524) TaxID=28072 RepID=UPI00029EE5B8|nr:hypothetical protein [Nostoc sp. PCC 7524]AFY46635.1 hypothetical protein Nos7524_0729 [Nostoc sp. PCC 7524]